MNCFVHSSSGPQTVGTAPPTARTLIQCGFGSHSGCVCTAPCSSILPQDLCNSTAGPCTGFLVRRQFPLLIRLKTPSASTNSITNPFAQQLSATL